MDNKKKNTKKLDLTDRVNLEVGLCKGEDFKSIAKAMGRHPASISREIRNNRTLVQGAFFPNDNDCRNARSCSASGICGSESCGKHCAICYKYKCIELCESYVSVTCKKYEVPPYVCNFCNDRKICQFNRYFYSAKRAQALSERRRSDSRSGARVTDDERAIINELVSKNIKKGQPLSHIYATYKDQLPVSERTIYNYISNGELSIKNIDLRRQAGYRKRKKKRGVDDDGSTPKLQAYRVGRTFEDYKEYMKDKTELIVTELDTVHGKQGKGNVLLTMFMRQNGCMLIFLMPDGKQESVIRVFDFLEEGLGIERFKRLFKVFLTDNGSEFKNVDALELNSELVMRTRVYYCDPMASWQKGRLEKNHEYIRYVIPKGTNLNQYTTDDIILLMNHINSTKRKSLNGNSPYDLMLGDPDMMVLMDLMKMDIIPPKEVRLLPDLLSLKNKKPPLPKKPRKTSVSYKIED